MVIGMLSRPPAEIEAGLGGFLYHDRSNKDADNDYEYAPKRRK